MENPALHRKNFLDGKPGEDNQKDVTWFGPEGRELTKSDWEDGALAAIGFLLNEPENADGGGSLLILANPEGKETVFQLPETEKESHWEILLDTVETEGDKSPGATIYKGPFSLPDHSLKILRKVK